MGKRWDKANRRRFAARAEAGSPADVAREAQVAVETVKNWMREFAPAHSQADPAAAVAGVSQKKVSPERLAEAAARSADDILHQLNDSMDWDFHRDALGELGALTDAVNVVGDANNPDSAYRNLLLKWTGQWADEAIESLLEDHNELPEDEAAEMPDSESENYVAAVKSNLIRNQFEAMGMPYEIAPERADQGNREYLRTRLREAPFETPHLISRSEQEIRAVLDDIAMDMLERLEFTYPAEDYHDEAMHEIGTLWDAICQVGDSQANGSPYVMYLDLRIKEWAKDVVENEDEVLERTMLEADLTDRRDEVSLATMAYLAQYRWSQLRTG